MNKNFYVVFLYFGFQIGQKLVKLVKSPIQFLYFSSLSIINTEKTGFLLMCFVKKGVLESRLSTKLPAANEWDCS